MTKNAGVVTGAFIRLPQVVEMTGLPPGSVYENVGNGTFPKPYRLSKRCVGWKLEQVRDWCEARPLAVDAPEKHFERAAALRQRAATKKSPPAKKAPAKAVAPLKTRKTPRSARA